MKTAAWALVCAVFATPMVGIAQTNSRQGDFSSLLDDALEHYEKGRYAEAIRSFKAAYDIDPKPNLLYNIARSHEKALEREAAIVAYRRFIDLPGTTAELRAKALDAIEALEREREARSRAALSRAPAPQPAAENVSVARPPEPRSRAAEWTLIGGGAVVAAVGGVFGILALEDERALEQARNDRSPLVERERLSSSTRDKALAADVLIGVGAASAVIGALLFAFTGHEESIAVSPTAPGDGGAGIAVAGRF